MPDFDEIQQEAKGLAWSLTKSGAKKQGCLSFFSSLVPLLTNSSELQDAATISLVAESLSRQYDKNLQDYLKFEKNTPKDLGEFKTQVLKGLYLLIWSRYHSTIANYWHASLIQRIKATLNMDSLNAMDEVSFKSCLMAFSQYCSFIFYQKSVCELYELINTKLGEKIQVDIHYLIHLDQFTDSSNHGFCKGLLPFLGMKQS